MKIRRILNRFLHPKSISRRFSYAFVGVVALVCIGFAAIAIFINIARTDTEIKNRLDNTINLAKISLATPLWNLDNEQVENIFDAILLDDSVVHVEVLWDKQVIVKKTRPNHAGKSFSFFEKNSLFTTQKSIVRHESKDVGLLQIAMSRERVRQQIIFEGLGIVGLVIIILSSISVTSIFITKRYIFNPLSKLKGSASLLASGELDANIDTASVDEIGDLAKDFDAMRGSIKDLIGELRDSNGKLEYINRTLEQKVDERTKDLARASEEAQQARLIAEEANSAKSAFLASMSHELRTPLNSIIGFTRIVLRKTEADLPPLQSENLKKVLISSESLLNLINGLLDLSKIEAGQMEIFTESFKLDEVIHTAASTVEPMMDEEQVCLVREIEPGIPPLLTDREKLRQIVLNLLSNAAKFTEKGEIKVAACHENGSLRLTVSDTGIGIEKEALSNIFEEFRQIDMSSTRSYGGTGLGLAIVKRLTNLLGGDVGVESEVNKGTKFTVTLPLSFHAQNGEG